MSLTRHCRTGQFINQCFNQTYRFITTPATDCVKHCNSRTLIQYSSKCFLQSKTSNCFQKTSSSESNQSSNQTRDSKQQGWINSLFPKRIETGTQPHSRLLSASEFIYEMHYHDSKPKYSEKYIDRYEKYSKELSIKTKNKAELVGSFRVLIGNQDQFIHIWRYNDGYKQASEIHKTMRDDQQLSSLSLELAGYLNKRETQFMTSFSFWNHPKPQDNNSYYEMRSYLLKPGTMIEWANGWSKGIQHRDNAVAGFFSQIGQLYTVHHIWRYEDLQVRKSIREDAWRKPGWDECVSITVPNIVQLHSRWMSPNKFSPIR